MIVGTAGHIDHGKSALIRALTGVDTDRLKEEKARGISIDLGFAYLPTEAGVIGFVDVPGHERFVRNMLAGATGIDFVLLVVAADDGVMPQTREHLAIVDLLEIPRALVALTKTDLVGAARRAAVEAEIRALLAPTRFAQAPLMAVSAATGAGVDALRAALIAAAQDQTHRPADKRFRLAVDRCFTLQGAGTVVTGVVMSGRVATGDTVAVSPQGLRARVRSLHAQNVAAEQGVAGQRCALNLVGEGITRQALARGDIVLDPALHAPTDRIDARLHVLPGEAKALTHWMPVRLHHAASETAARLALLDRVPLAPGATGWAQLVLEAPIAAAVGDRFILRDTSGTRTLGGGRMVDLRAPHRRRGTPERLAQLQALAEEVPARALALALACAPWFVDLAAFARDRLLTDAARERLAGEAALKRATAKDSDFAFAPEVWEKLVASALRALGAFHAASPEQAGLTPARLAPLLEPRLPPRVAAAVLAALLAEGALASTGGALHRPDHAAGLAPADRALWQRLAPRLDGAERFRPPRVVDLAEALRGKEADIRRLLKAQARLRAVIEIAPDHFFLRSVVAEMAQIAARISAEQAEGWFSAAQFRDALDNGRKVAIQVLEFFDRQGVTLRRGDLRRVNPQRLAIFAS